MRATRHTWITDFHADNPYSLSLTRPITIVESEDIDIEFTAPGETESQTLACSIYEFIFPYRDQERQPRIGRGRMYLPPAIESRPAPRTVSTLLSIHYEHGIDGSKRFLAEGWAVITPYGGGDDHMFNLVGSGMDHTLEMAKLVRRLGFVDLQRIGWFGGSAGGYQCLITAESIWPVAGAVANVPLSDLEYDLACIEWSERYNRGITDERALTIPIVRFVKGISDGTRRGTGNDPDVLWKNSAPIGAPLIRSPLVIHTCTGDLLCPAPQIGPDFERVPERGVMPPGWTNSYARFHHPESLGKPLTEWIPQKDVETIAVAIPETAPHVEIFPPPEGAEQPPVTPFRMKLPFSRSTLVTAVLQDEGAPDPKCGHSKYVVDMDVFPFFRYHFTRGYVPPEHLTPLVLTRLIGRFDEKTLQNSTLPPIRRGYEDFDQYETILALRTFLGEPERAENVSTLRRMYRELPPVQRQLDVTQDDVTARFDEAPTAALFFHEATLMRKRNETARAEQCESILRAEHAGTTWAKLKTEVE